VTARAARAFVALLAVLWAVPAAGLGAEPAAAPPAPAIAVTTTASGISEAEEQLDWKVQASVADPLEAAIPRGGSATVAFRVEATRTGVAAPSRTGVRGEVCLQNYGAVDSGPLRVVARAQAVSVVGQLLDLPGASQTILPTPLAPGERACHPYELLFPPALTGGYRLVATVSAGGPPATVAEAAVPFALPGTPAVTRHDVGAELSLAASCPAGLSCAPAASGDIDLAEPGVVEVDVVVHNDGAACDVPLEVGLAARLTESDSGAARDAAAAAFPLSGPCPPGCALPVDHWSTHSGFTDFTPDRVGPLLPQSLGLPGGTTTVTVTGAGQALPILSFARDRANGINRLYAQLLAAKLNVANGTDAAAAAPALAAADALLAEHDASDWTAYPDKAGVVALTDLLAAYNDGLAGPPSCDAAEAAEPSPL